MKMKNKRFLSFLSQGFLFSAYLCVLCGGVQAQVLVNIADTLKNAEGTNASGRLVISWDPFTTAAGVTIDGGTITYTITAGVINLNLTPNIGATPAGTSYRARYFLTNGAAYTETWVVPAAGPVTIAGVRVSTVPSPTVLFDPTTQLYKSTVAQGDLLVGSSTAGYFARRALGTVNQCLTSNGTTAVWGSCAVGGTGITSLNLQTGATQAFANDTNITITSATNTHTLGWSGTLAAARLNANVVQAVTNDTNVTGSIAAQTLTLSWAGALSLARLPFGAANQVLGTNAGATAQEHKTLSVGTAGTDFAIAHAANSITLNLPDASATARGAVSLVAQTMGAGNKTFTGLSSFGVAGSAVTRNTVTLLADAPRVLFGTQATSVNWKIGAQDAVGSALDFSSSTETDTDPTNDTWNLRAYLNSVGGFVPGTTGQDLGTTVARWDVFGQAGNFGKAIFSTLTTVAFVATPTFDASLGNSFKITLTGNVTSSTISNQQTGQFITFEIVQDAIGGRTFAWPANTVGAMTINAGANSTSPQTFLYDGANWIGLEPDASAMVRGALASADWTTFNNKVPATRNVNTTAPLGGGGALSGDLTLTCTGCLTSVTAHSLLSATHSDTVAASPVLGDILIGNGTPAWARLAGNITTARQFLSQTGTGTVSALPAWGSLADSDIPDTITLTNITQITNRAISDTTGTLSETRGGTNQTTYTLGDLLYSSAANTLAKLAGNTTAGKQFLTQTGTGTVSAAPVWGQPAFADLSGAATDAQIPNTITLDNLTQITTRAIADTTGTLAVGRGGTGATTFTLDGVLLGNTTAVVAVTTAGTANQVFRVPGAGGSPAFGAVDLAQAAAVTGLLPDANIAATLTRDSEWPGATATLTNKTLDAEGTGNVITIPVKVNYKAAVCQNATASLGFSTPTTNAATAACVTGTNTQYGVAQFPDGAASISVQDHFPWPSDFTGAVDLGGKWRTSAITATNVVWQVQTICVADAETGDPAFNTASTVTDATKGVANQFNDFSMTSITITGCAAGEEFFFKFFRDPAHASDTLAATAELISLTFTVRRTM